MDDNSFTEESTALAASSQLAVELKGLFQIRQFLLELGARFGKGIDTIFTARLGDLSLGTIIEYLVGLAVPGFRLQLTPPWDVINSINLRNLTFELNVTESKAGFAYGAIGLDLAFFSLEKVEVFFATSGKRSVDISLYGRLLDKDFTKEPLTWDLLTQPAPAVPTKGPKTFDLEYLGLGQRVTLRDIEKLTTLGEVIDALEASYRDVPKDENPLNHLPALKFDAGSGWLIGTKFSALQTVALSAVFNDPKMYGLRVALSGERAKSLAGLEFEILYQKVSDDVGRYHIELKLPDAFRQIQAGAASITLPIIDVDIYTNGNFLIDLGFPHNLDFSRSLVVQVLVGPVPVLGAGGLYFGVLSGETSEDVPKITNGDFAPVIVFGVGARLGVGKTFDKGILKAGAFLAVQGLLEGVVGFFQPSSPTVAKATFYRIDGAIGIVAHIYGSIDFSIVKATLDIYAYATVQGVFESYMPTVLSFEAGVRVELAVRVNLGIFKITIQLSFSATFQTSMEIGSAQETPWKLAAGGGESANSALFARASEGRGFRPLEGGWVCMDRVFSRVAEEGLHWRGVRVAEVSTLTLTFQPMVSIGFVDDHPGAVGGEACPSFGPDAKQQVQLVAALFIQGPERGGAEAGLSDFALLAKYGLLWALDRVREAEQRAGGVIRADDPATAHVTLSELRCAFSSLSSPEAVDVCDVIDFLRLNFAFEIEPPPQDFALADELGGRDYVVFPMLPFLTMNAGDGAYEVDFETKTPCSRAYRRFLTEYFEQIAARDRPRRQAPEGAPRTASGDPSMAAAILMDYLLIILREVLGKAIGLFESYPYAAREGDTLEGIARRFGLVDSGAVARIVRANQDRSALFAERAALDVVAGAVRVSTDDTLAAVAERSGLQTVNLALAVRHQKGLLSKGAELRVEGGSYTLQPADTLAGIAEKFFTTAEDIRQANPDFPWTPVPPGQSVPVGKLIHLPATDFPAGEEGRSSLAEIAGLFRVSVAALATRNADRPILTPGMRAFFPLVVQVREGDSVAELARRFGLADTDLAAVIGDQPGLLVGGAEVEVADGCYLLREEDTVAGIASRFATTEAAIFAANPGFDWTPPPGLAVPWGKTIRLGEVKLALGMTDTSEGGPLDTLDAVARFVGLSPDKLISQLRTDEKLLLPLAALQLPRIPYAVADGDTLEKISRRFGVTAFGLAAANSGPETRFGEVLVPEVETLPQETLLTELEQRGEFTASTGTVSRFLLDGLRLPAPDEVPEGFEAGLAVDWAALCVYPLYTLTGQQWGAPASPGVEYTVRLTLDGAGDGQPCSPPKITFDSDTPEDGLTIHLSELDVETIGGFAKLLGTGRPPFDPEVLALTRLAPYSTVGKHYSLGKAVPWQAPEVPLFTSEPLDQAAGRPSLFALPQGLRDQVSALDGRPAPLVLEVGSQQLAAGPRVEARAAVGYGWATRFEIRLRRAPAPGTANRFLPALYEVFSGDARSREAMLDLATYLRGPGRSDEVTLHLLYSANPSSAESQGLVSDPVEATEVLLLKVNLTTLTRSPASDLDLLQAPSASDEGLFSASLADAASFLTLLWEASVVNSGGYYLSYRIGGGQGLPAQLFNQDPEATLTVLAIVRPAGKPETIGLLPFHNAVVFTENLDSEDSVVFATVSRYPVVAGDDWTGIARRLGLDPAELARANATLPCLLRPGAVLTLAGRHYEVLPGDDLLTVGLATGAALAEIASALGERRDVLLAGARMFRGPEWVALQPSLSMGDEGFRMVRRDPDPEISAGLASTSQDDPATALQVRFNLLGFRLDEGGAFKKSAEGLPASPGHSTGSPGGGAAGELLGLPATADENPPWLYQRVLEVARHGAGDGGPSPVPGPDPYTGLGGKADIHLQLQDLFGNLGLADGVLPGLGVDVLYRDLVIGFNQWPAGQSVYRFSPGADSPRMEVSFSFDPSRYTPPPGSPFKPFGERAAKDRDFYGRIYFQVAQKDVGFAVSTSVDGHLAHALDKEILLPLVVAAWSYLDTVAAMIQVSVPAAAGDTLEKVAGEYRVAVPALAEVNGDDPGLLAEGAEVIVPLFYSVVLNDALETILKRTGAPLSAGELGRLNRSQPLQAGTVMTLPDGGTHEVRRGETLSSIGRAQQPPALPSTLAELNDTLPNLFPESEQLSLGSSSVTIEKGDTLASLARDRGIGLATLAEANAGREILAAKASIAIPSHLHLGDETRATHLIQPEDTFSNVAAHHGTSVELLGLANQDLDGVLASGATLVFGAQQETVGENDNLATVLARFRISLADPGLSAGALAVANQERDVLRAGSRMLVSPPVAEAAARISQDDFLAEIFPVTAVAVLRRSKDLIDPAFAGVPGVESASAPLAPRLTSTPDTGLGLSEFAECFEAAFGQRLRLATGAAPSGGAQDLRLVAVQWQTPDFGFKILPRASFYAPRPLSNTPWSGTAPIRPYQSGDPLGPARPKSFHGIDLDTWGRAFLAAMDRVLSPGSSLAAFRLAPAAFDRLVAAKGALAEAISGTVAPIMADTVGDLKAAEKALRQQLLIQLSEAYVVDALVQFPVEVSSPFTDPDTAPRLSGKPRGAVYVLPEDATLEKLAEQFLAPLSLLARVIAPVQEILEGGFEVHFDAKTYEVLPGDSLAKVAREVETSPEKLAAALETAVGFLRAGAALDLQRRSYTFTKLDTLATTVAWLAPDASSDEEREAALEDFAAMNQSVPDIFRPGKKIEIDGHEHVTRRGDSLDSIGEALGVSALAVVREELDTEELVRVGAEVSYLVLSLGFSMSDAKVSLFENEASDSSLTFLFQTNSAVSRLSLRMGFDVNELEYGIHDVSWARGYQTSSWLSFIRPIADDSLGEVEVPIPLRAYPEPPVVDGQDLEQSYPAKPSLEQIKTYDYRYTFTYRPAAQDTLFTSYESNTSDDAKRAALGDNPSLPQWLAQYSAIAPPLEQDLAFLATPAATGDSDVGKLAANALEIFSEIAGHIAETWKTWTPRTAASPADRPVYLVRHRRGADGRGHLRLHAANTLAASLRPPDATLVGRSVEGEIEGPDFVVRTFAPARGPDLEAARFQDQFSVRVRDLEVIGTQNIWGSVAVKRNFNLLPERTTNPDFTYQLDDVRFTSKLVPLIRYPAAFDMTSLPPVHGEPEEPKLLKYVIRLFHELLMEGAGTSLPQARYVRVTTSFGFLLAGEERSGGETPLTTRVPVLLRPVFLFEPARDLETTSGFCFDLASRLQEWIDPRKVEDAPGGRWIFDVSVYSTLPGSGGAGASRPPLLELTNLYLSLKALEASRGRNDHS